MKFEVPQRQQTASERTSLTLFAPAPSTISFVPLTRNLSLADPSTTPSGGRQASRRQLPPAFQYSGQPSAMRFRKRAVPNPPFYGTELTLGAQKGFLGYATHLQRHSVLKTGFYGTEEIFGAKNRLLWYAAHFQRCAKRHPVTPNAFSTARRTADSTDCGQPPAALDAFQRRPCQKQHLPTGRIFRGGRAKSSLLPHRTHLQCAKRPPLSLFAPAPSTISFVPLTRNLSPADPSPAPSTALGTGNGPRSKTRRTASARR